MKKVLVVGNYAPENELGTNRGRQRDKDKHEDDQQEDKVALQMGIKLETRKLKLIDECQATHNQMEEVIQGVLWAK